MNFVSIEGEYLIVDRGCAAYVGKLGHGLKLHVSIHVSRWCVMDFPVQWDVVIDILGVLLRLVKNDSRNKALTIRYCDCK